MAKKTFFITGANSGFGLAIASAAIQAGHTVVGTVRSETSRAALRRSLSAIRTVICDVTEFDRVPDVVAQAEEEHGPVDVLINNAGYGHEGVLEESPLEEMRRQFDVNVFGAVAVAKAFLPRFRERRRGFIVNVTSMGGMITMPGIAYYCGSKFALQGISEVMRSEMAPFGVRVTAVCPGSFRTDWAGRSMVPDRKVHLGLRCAVRSDPGGPAGEKRQTAWRFRQACEGRIGFGGIRSPAAATPAWQRRPQARVRAYPAPAARDRSLEGRNHLDRWLTA